MKILVIRFSSLGDIILSTAILRNLKESFPEAEICFYTKEEYVPVLENNPNIDYILTWKKKQNALKNLLWIRRRKFDLVIDIHNNLRTFILKKVMRYDRFLTYDKAIKERRELIKEKHYSGRFMTVIDRYNEVLKSQGLRVTNSRPEIYLSDEEIKWGAQFFKDRFPEDDNPECVGIACGAKWWTKRWIPERYIALALELTGLKIQALFLGENQDKNFILPHFGKLKKEEREEIHILLGELDLRKLFVVISHLRLLITTDSAPMHIARAFNIPVVLIAGPTVREFGFFPSEKEGVVVETSLLCRPCSLHGSKKCLNPMQTFECMKNIKVEDVLAQVKRLLGKTDTEDEKAKQKPRGKK